MSFASTEAGWLEPDEVPDDVECPNCDSTGKDNSDKDCLRCEGTGYCQPSADDYDYPEDFE